MIGYLLLGALALTLAAKRKQSGVGKIKVWQCIEKAQRYNVPFGNTKWSELSDSDRQNIDTIGRQAGYKQTKASLESGKEYGEAFYGYLNNKYKSIAGLGKIVIEYPCEEAHVKNENGDLILLHRDYDSKKDIEDAVNAVDNMLTTDAAHNGYLLTLQYLARGGKVVWSNLMKGGDVIKRGLESELFGGKRNNVADGNKKVSFPYEKKLRRRILGTEKNGAKYPEQLAEEFAQHYGGDDYYYKNGVLDALQRIGTKQQAQEELLDLYYYTYFAKEVPDGLDPDGAPF